MFKRAQAAMEFLMTYGWAILAVLAAIGALAHFGVLSPGNLLPQKCEFQSGFDCTETPTARSNAISVALTNSNGYDLVIDDSTVGTNTYDCSDVVISPVGGGATWQNGEAAVVEFSNCSTSWPAIGERYKTELSFNVTSEDSGLEHWVAGSVAGKIAG